MTPSSSHALVETLKARFEANMHRHPGVSWEQVQARLESRKTALRSLGAMEASGGEPDVIAHDKTSGQCTFCDCSPESPTGRRSLCYDRQALVLQQRALPFRRG